MFTRTRECITNKQPVSMVLYGDSISEVKPGWNGGATSPEANWGAVLAARLHDAFPSSTFRPHHFGIGGQNSEEGLARIGKLSDFSPDLVLVAFGANDCCYHWLEPAETKRALITLVTKIREDFGGDVALVGTAGDNPQQPFFKHLEETLQAQKEVAAEADVPYIDTRSAILKGTDNGAQWATFHIDEGNCHPTDSGHRIWAQAALDVLQPALTSPSA